MVDHLSGHPAVREWLGTQSYLVCKYIVKPRIYQIHNRVLW